MATATRENIEGAAFYSYLFAKAKPIPTPTPILDALLRALALHIKTEIDDKKEPHLTPAKLATFYKNAGYNFDSLFVDMPHLFISDVFQGLGCRHWLLPTDNDYAAPSVPALTIEGFVRWQAIQILLEPSTQVPIMQFAVRNWCLKHPDTGILFPPDLPAEAFPMNSDLDTEAWYQECKNKHIRAAEEEKPTERPTEKPAEESRPFGDRKAPFTRIHVQPSPRDYFESRPPGRNVKVTYVNVAPGPSARSPERDRERAREHERAHREAYLRRQASSPNEPSRRRSFSDYPHSPNDTRPAAVRVSPHLAPERGPQQQRRHSQPRHYSTSESDTPVSPRTTRRSPHRPPSDAPIPGVRRVYTGSSEDIPRIIRTSMPPPPIPTAHSQPIGRTHSPRPSTPRDDDGKRRGALYEIRDKISNLVNGTSERQRSLSGGRGRKDGPASSSARGSRDENHPSSRLSRSWSNHETDDTDSEDERIRRSRKRSRESREREQRERERAAAHERERERERDRARDRERDRHRDRHSDRDRDSDERRHSDRDRERERRGRDRPPSAPRTLRSHVSDTGDDDITPRERFSRGSGGSNGPYLSRPDVHRRTSSHADIDRRRDLDREIRDRDYLHDQRDRDRAGRDRERWRREERLSPRDHGGDRSRERDRERKNDGEARRERMASPSAAAAAAAASLGPGGVTSGVGGRKYPDLGSWQGRD